MIRPRCTTAAHLASVGQCRDRRVHRVSASQLARAGKIQLNGDESALATLAGVMDEFDPNFNIVIP
ncbi:MAG: alkyl sulfatase C-terminal domain-containing protein [Streptosporangiaceae bacterium]